MKTLRRCFLFFSFSTGLASAQVPGVEPQIVSKPESEATVTVIETAARFVSAIRLPEPVNSVVVGDPSAFQVEHSERESKLVFVKALTTKPAETNLLISTVSGRNVSLLLVNRGEGVPGGRSKVNFLLKYEAAGGFLVQPACLPSSRSANTRGLAYSFRRACARRGRGRKPSSSRRESRDRSWRPRNRSLCGSECKQSRHSADATASAARGKNNFGENHSALALVDRGATSGRGLSHEQTSSRAG